MWFEILYDCCFSYVWMEVNGVLGIKCGCGLNGVIVDDILFFLKLDEGILEVEDWLRFKSELMEVVSLEV